MENNKKDHPKDDLSLHNNPDQVVDSDKEEDKDKVDKVKVNFHSDFINEKVGDLDITV